MDVRSNASFINQPLDSNEIGWARIAFLLVADVATILCFNHLPKRESVFDIDDRNVSPAFVDDEVVRRGLVLVLLKGMNSTNEKR